MIGLSSAAQEVPVQGLNNMTQLTRIYLYGSSNRTVQFSCESPLRKLLMAATTGSIGLGEQLAY